MNRNSEIKRFVVNTAGLLFEAQMHTITNKQNGAN